MSPRLPPLWSLVLCALGVPLCGVRGSFCVVDQLLPWSDRRGWPLAQLVARPCLVEPAGYLLAGPGHGAAGCRALEDPVPLLAHKRSERVLGRVVTALGLIDVVLASW